MTKNDTGEFELPIDSAKAEVLCSNADVKIKIKDGKAVATFSKPRAYAFVKLK